MTRSAIIVCDHDSEGRRRHCSAFKDRGIEVWVDGGWGVDALLGKQTRSHGDIDLVVRESDIGRLVEALVPAGFRQVEGGRSFNFVMAGSRGREVDVHTVVFDAAGNGLYGPQADDGTGMRYPADAFRGEGAIDGESVRCMTAAYQIANHAGYELREADFHDLRRLHDKFGLPPPVDLR